MKMADSKHNDEDPISDEELRPQALDDFIGQPRLKAQMSLFLKAAQKRNVPPDHILLAGPPGLGKTTLAMIVAHELNVPIRVTSGPAISHAGDLASILSSLDEGEVLFYVIEETRVNGVNYLLVTDSEEDEADCYILKDTSPDEAKDAVYEMVEDEDVLNALQKVFKELLEDTEIEF